MSININDNVDLELDDFLSFFKRLYKFIKDELQKNKPKEELTFEELVDLYSNDKNFLSQLDYIKSLLDDIDELLENINFAYYEYYNFLSIKDMINYIIDDVGKYIRYSPFILSLLNAFNNLMDSLNDSDYGNIYEEFDIFLDKQEDVFYAEIFEGTPEYDDLIVKVTNILW